MKIYLSDRTWGLMTTPNWFQNVSFCFSLNIDPITSSKAAISVFEKKMELNVVMWIFILKKPYYITGHEKDYIISNNLPFHSACYLLEIYGDNKLCYIIAAWSSRRKRILQGNLPVSLNAIPAYPKATRTYANKR